jgi:hypothetical protein
MNKPSLTPGLQKFCERVRVMNQSNSKNLVLTAAEARNIESDLVDLLLLISNLSSVQSRQADTVEIEIQSPAFK